MHFILHQGNLFGAYDFIPYHEVSSTKEQLHNCEGHNICPPLALKFKPNLLQMKLCSQAMHMMSSHQIKKWFLF